MTKKVALVCSLMVLGACSMPGVGELEERVDSLEAVPAYDDSEIAGRMDSLEEQFLALEGLLALPADFGTDSTGHGAARPSIDPSQILLLQEGLATMTDTLSALGGDLRTMGDSISALNGEIADLTDSLAASGEALEEIGIAVDSLTADNEAMKEDIEDLQGALWSIQQANQEMMGTSGRPSGGGTGSRDSGSGSGSGSGGGRDTGGGSTGR